MRLLLSYSPHPPWCPNAHKVRVGEIYQVYWWWERPGDDRWCVGSYTCLHDETDEPYCPICSKTYSKVREGINALQLSYSEGPGLLFFNKTKQAVLYSRWNSAFAGRIGGGASLVGFRELLSEHSIFVPDCILVRMYTS